MPTSRRDILKTLLSTPLYASAAHALPLSMTTPMPTTLPDKQSFPGTANITYLNAAFTHPLGVQGYNAAEAFLQARVHDPSVSWPRTNPRSAAVEAFAGLINAASTEVAVVPSTMGGENMVCAALALGPDAGVVTDAFHYDASLAMYGEMQLHGIPVAVVKPHDNRIHLEDIEPLLQKNIRLLAISLIGSLTGHQHDLKALCDLAHSKNILVYADIIQAAGAIPIDVKQSGIDFACCGTYKWLMGEFGVAFLYVRPDRLDQLHRMQWGWRSFRGENHHILPFDPPGPAIGDWTLGNTTASHFEVGTPDWAALAASVSSIAYVRSLTVEAIQRYRQPMIDRLQAELPKLGFERLTPAPTTGPTVAFAYKGVSAKFGPALDKAKIRITLAEDHIRVSPSVYNDMEDIERLLAAFRS